MTVANEMRVEHRRAPRTPGRHRRRRMRRAHDPSRFRRRRRRLRRYPQQQSGDAGGLRGERQFSAGDEIELACLAPYLQHDSADRVADQCIRRSAQRALGIGRAHGHDQPRIEAEFAKSTHRQRAGFHFRKILPHPDQRLSSRNPPRHGSDKTGRRRALMSFGKHLMQRSHREPAAQHRIRTRMTKRNAIEGARITVRLEALDTAAQRRKRACACAVHSVAVLKL